MRRPLQAWALAVLLMVSLVGCTPDPVEPEAVDDCEGLVAVGTNLVEDYLSVVEGLSLAVLRGEAPMPPELVVLNDRGAELDLRVVRLGCDVDAVNTAIVEATSGLEAETPAGDAFLGIVRAGVVGQLPELPPEEPDVVP